MNFWKFRLRLDDYFFELVNKVLILRFFVLSLFGRKKHMKKNSELKNKHSGQRGFLVANGPSLKKQDIKKLRGKLTFFVNHSYLHKDYAFVKPTYHIIIDSKLQTGEWSLDMLDIIKSKNPDVIFLLNANWYNDEKFAKYQNSLDYKIYWVDMKLFTTPFDRTRQIDLTKITYGAAVTGVAKMGMIYMGVNEIYFLGKDGNGLCYELISQDSHFYGVNPENKLKSIENIYTDLYMMSLSLKHWTYFNAYAERNGVSIYNCTEGGIFNMFVRKKFEDIIDES